MQIQTIQIPKNDANMIQNWLDQHEPHPEHGECDTIKTYTVSFTEQGEEIEVDIKVVNSDSGPYIDAVMFEAGCEVGFLEVRDTLLGVYDFRDDQHCYRVIVEQIA